MNHFTRRKFLRNGIAAGAVVSTLPAWLLSCRSDQRSPGGKEEAKAESTAAQSYFDYIGVPLYTLRDAFATNPEQTLKDIPTHLRK